MNAFVSKVGDIYEVSIYDPSKDGLQTEKLKLNEEEYIAFISSGRVSSIIQDPMQPLAAATPTESSNSAEPVASSAELPSLPDNATQEQIQEFKKQLKDEDRFYGSGDAQAPSLLPVEDPNKGKDEIPDVLEDGDTEHTGPDFGSGDSPDGTNADAKTTDASSNLDNKKSELDKGDFDQEQNKLSRSASNSGLLNSKLFEPVPDFKSCNGDVVQGGINNQWIVFGRDRSGGYTTGYGPGQGNTQAGAIDIVVGRMSPHVRSKNRDGTAVRVGPIFNYASHEGRQVCDASRIYLSQKTDMDHNFSLVSGRIGKPIARSGIVLKSDGVRIIARDSGIKLVTHTRQLMNSQGGKSAKAPSGIDIIAGNDDTNLQPMVLGDNLVAMLREHNEAINNIVGTITSIIENLAKIDVALATHFHPQAFPAGVPNLPSPALAPVCVESLVKLISLDTFSAYAEKWKLEKIDKLYLSQGAPKGVRSTFNNVN